MHKCEDNSAFCTQHLTFIFHFPFSIFHLVAWQESGRPFELDEYLGIKGNTEDTQLTKYKEAADRILNINAEDAPENPFSVPALKERADLLIPGFEFQDENVDTESGTVRKSGDDGGTDSGDLSGRRAVDNSENSGIIKSREKILSAEDETAINQYLSSESYVVNEKLRDNIPLSEGENELVQALDSALNKLPEYGGTVYRSISSTGIRDIDEFWEKHKKGQVINYLDYTSTSTDIYDETMDIQFVIRSRRGKDFRLYNNNENEILFKRGTYFRVTDVKGNIIYMEEV